MNNKNNHDVQTKKPPLDLTNGGFSKLVELPSVEGVETVNSHISIDQRDMKQVVIRVLTMPENRLNFNNDAKSCPPYRLSTHFLDN